MLLHILDKDFNVVAVIDSFNSYLWTDRYSSHGDFEYYADATTELIKYMQKEYYIWTEESEHVMIIEERTIETDIEKGATISVVGRSLESILDRRIMWKETALSGNLQDNVLRLLNEHFINPTDPTRKFPNLIFKPSTNPEITSLTIAKQFTADIYIYDAIKDICDTNGLGFKIILNDDNIFVFSLYKGTDRSYAQDINPYVVFSSEFDNLNNSNFFDSITKYKNVAFVAGEGEGAEQKNIIVGDSIGIDRREIYVDATNVSSVIKIDDEEIELTPQEYDAFLINNGQEILDEFKIVETFESDVDFNKMFILNKDFFIGDIVQIYNEFNIESSVRITEILTSYDANGHNIIPTFEKIE